MFFLIRALSLELRSIEDTDLPLTKPENSVKENDKLDLSKNISSTNIHQPIAWLSLDNSDLIACTVHMKEM